MRSVLLAAGLIILSAAPAIAKEWTIDYAHSKLGFTGMQGTTNFDGSFGKFDAHVDLDPDHPETGKITATVDITSISAGDAQRDSVLPGPDWFNSKQFPQAQFASTSIVKKGDVFVADGNLTIKGIAKPVTLKFTLAQDGDHWHAQGRTTLLRNNFNIGIGSWANENYVRYAVDVVIDISAKPQ